MVSGRLSAENASVVCVWYTRCLLCRKFAPRKIGLLRLLATRKLCSIDTFLPSCVGISISKLTWPSTVLSDVPKAP